MTNATASRHATFARYPIDGYLSTVVILSHDGERATVRPLGDFRTRFEVPAADLLEWPGPTAKFPGEAETEDA